MSTTAGERVLYWRKIKGLSIRKLASKADLHRSSLHRIESGQQELHASELERVVAALDLTMAEFFGEEARAS